MLVNLEQSFTRLLALLHGGSSDPGCLSHGVQSLGDARLSVSWVLTPTRGVEMCGPGCLGRRNLEMPDLWPERPLELGESQEAEN